MPTQVQSGHVASGT